MMKLSVFIVFVHFMLGLCKEIRMSKSLYRCRQICYTKFVQDWHHCMDNQGCKDMCITPPNINNYIPEAFSFLCWNKCDETLEPFSLSVTSASRQGSLILATIAWDQTITNSSKQCLVTWEVSGGGLMGNLLTDTSTVELSLWVDTVYHVQVTCKNKETGTMRRSNQLIVDTRKLTTESPTSSSVSPSHLSSTQSISPIPTISSDPSVKNVKKIEDIFLRKSFSKENKNHLQILKDSSTTSKDRFNNKIEITTRTTTEKSLSHIPTVIRSKLVGGENDNTSADTSSFSSNIIYAMIESVIVFLGIVFIYILIRSSRDDTQMIDKEELIRNEFLSGNRRIVHM